MLKLGPQLKRWGRTGADWIVFVFAQAFCITEQKLLGGLCFLGKAGMAFGLATEMLFSSQFPVVDVGAVWMVKGTFFLSLC